MQTEYNAKHGITPETVKSAISSGIEEEIAAHKYVQEVAGQAGEDYVTEEYLQQLHARDAARGGGAQLRARRRAARPHRQAEGTADDGAAGEEAARATAAVMLRSC